MNKYIFLFLAFCISNIAIGQNDKDWESKIAPSLWKESNRSEALNFLVVLYAQTDVQDARWIKAKEAKAEYVFQALKQTAIESQKEIRQYLDKHQIEYHSLYIINGLKTEGGIDLVTSLAQRPDVSHILQDEVVTTDKLVEVSVEDISSRSAVEWGIDMINADDVWAMGYRGQGVTVGGEDTGYDWTHPALINQYRGYDAELDTADHNYNWHDAIHDYNPANGDSNNICGINLVEPCDDRGHGTHTMGTMIGLDEENQIGVAPEANWCGCRNMERGWGTLFSYIECFEWFLAPTDLNNENPDPSKAPHVINNSWNCPLSEGCDSSNYEIMEMVVNNLRASGIVVVVSAGNNGPLCSTIYKPATMFEGSFTIGATASNDTIAEFSSRGHVTVDSSFRIKPNVSAPGVSIRSASAGGGYNNSSGTSMAAPHVAGLVALMISANPALAGNVDLIEDIIENTAVAKTTDQECGGLPGFSIPNNTYGHGRVDALAAVEEALSLIETSTGDDYPAIPMKVYPNPFSHKLIFSFEALPEGIRIELFDARGRIIYHHNLNGNVQSFHRIDLGNQPSGIYFYRVFTKEGVQQGKVIKS